MSMLGLRQKGHCSANEIKTFETNGILIVTFYITYYVHINTYLGI